MKTLSCGRCQSRVFFENTACGACGAVLGFDPQTLKMVAFEIDANGQWQRLGPSGSAQRPCANLTQYQVCNWTVSADAASPYCLSCSTTAVIPALGKEKNRSSWHRLEQAKRRLFYSLIGLHLPIESKAQDPARGLSFEFLESTRAKPVLTGHANGVITMNIAEADDARREQVRTRMHEPYRTLLGHFRHEIGHYYWDRLIAGSTWLDEFRQIFGDERADYQQALQQHYDAPAADWPERFVSAYASAHPWEDWAECWAHYLHIQDGLETASAWGLGLTCAAPGAPAIQAHDLAMDAPCRDHLIQQWLPVSQFINAMNRSLGMPDSYPFVLPEPVLSKLEFIHRCIGTQALPEQPPTQTVTQAVQLSSATSAPRDASALSTDLQMPPAVGFDPPLTSSGRP